MAKNGGILDMAATIAEMTGNPAWAMGFKIASEAIKAAAYPASKWLEWQKASFEVARNIGMTHEQAKNLNKALRNTVSELSQAYGLTHAELTAIQESYTNAVRGAKLLNEQQFLFAASMQKVGVNLGDITTQIENLGGGFDTAGAYFELTQERAMKFGLNAKQTTEAFVKNIDMAQKYGFKNGVNGLSQMVMLSQKLHFNMEQVGKVADKFEDIEGAIDASAKLQVLGGSFAANFANPLEVMTQSLTDMEGLTKRITDTFAAKGTLRSDGTVEFSPVDRRMMKEAAQSLGMSADEVFKMATAQVTSKEVEKQVNKTQGFSQDQIDAITNLATFNADTQKYEISYTEDGEIKTVNVEDMTKATLSAVAPYADAEKAMALDVSDIAGNVRTLAGKSKERVSDTVDLSSKMNGVGEEWNAFFSSAFDWLDWLNPEFAYTSKKLLGFSTGGIVPSNVDGAVAGKDSVMSMLMPGEVVLNEKQQENIINALPHYAEGGAIGANQNQLYDIAKNGYQGQNSSSNGLMQKAMTAYVGRQILADGKLVDGLNKLGASYANSTQGLSSRLGALSNNIKESTIVQKSLNQTSKIGNAIRQSRSVRYIADSRIGQTVGAIGSNRFQGVWGKSSVFGKQMKIASQALKGEWGTALSNQFNQVGPGRLMRYVDAIKGGHARTLWSVSRNNRTFQEVKGIWKPLQESTKQVASSLSKVSATASNSATALKGTTSAIKNFGGKGLASLGGKIGLKSLGRAIPGVGTALSVGIAAYDAINAISDFKSQKAQILADENMSDEEKRNTINQLKDDRNEKIGSAAGGAIGAAIGMSLGSAIPVFGTAIGGMVGGFIGDKIGGFVGKNASAISDFLFGEDQEDNMTREQFAQRNYENAKMGYEALAEAMQDPSGEEVKLLAAQATVKMHDILVSMNNHMHGKTDNGEDIDKGLLGGLGKFLISPALAVGSALFKGSNSKVSPTPLYNQPTQLSQIPENELNGLYEAPKPQDININVNGTLNLNGGGQSESIDIKKLLNNHEFVSKIKDIVLEGLQRSQDGGSRNLNTTAAQRGYV